MQRDTEYQRDGEEIVRPKDAREIDGYTNAQRHRQRREGTYPEPFKISPDPKSRAVGWLRRELLARRAAVMRGDSVEQLQALARKIESDRKARGIERAA